MNIKLSNQSKGNLFFRFVLMSLLSCFLILPANAQSKITVTGKVTDSSNEPLAGAYVLEEGTKNGVSTDIDGIYTITASSSSKLVFSYVGFKTAIMPIQNRSLINISLESDASVLQEVVTIGYGSSRKQDLSMAVTSMKMDNITKSRSSNLATVLQGKMPGVIVQQSGDPMSSASFTIRGRGSKGNDGDPSSGDGVLFVVDGVPGAPFAIDDIESITVLKDAASASIYGASVGSSGVVLITTKRARSGKVNVDVNVSMGLEQVSRLPKVLTAEQYNKVWAKAIENAPGKTLPSAANPTLYPWGNVTRTDWLDEIFRIGTKQHYSAIISGGTDKLSSIFSVSYDNKKGILLNTWSKAFKGKLQTEYNLTKWLKLYERLSVDISNGQGNVSTNHQGPIMAAMWYPRSASVYERKADGTFDLDANGNKFYGGTTPRWATVSGTPLVYNPVAYLNRLHQLYPSTKVFSTTGIEIRPISSLVFKSEFTADFAKSEEDNFYPKMMERGLLRAENFREQYFINTYHWLSENTITWAQIFGKHHISAMGGFTADFKHLDSKYFHTKKYTSEDPNQLLWSLAQDYSSIHPSQTIYEYAMASFFGRLGYSYDDRYFLTASIRRDASSKLPIAKNYDWFPAFSGSWKLSSEHFFKNSNLTKVFDLIKFRAGWGKVGNVDLYPTNVADVELLNYRWPIILGKDLKTLRTGSYLSTIPNTNARWETTAQASVGLDLTMFNNSLDITVDWYNKETKDLIDFIPTPSQIGVKNPPMGNMGHVINRGWEFSIAYHGSIAGNVNYDVWGMYSYNNGYVKDYGPRSAPVRHDNPNVDSKSLLYSAAGQPWYSFMLYKTAGIFRSQEEIDNYKWTNPETGISSPIQPLAKVGDLKYVDTNNDGKINDNDKIFMGSYAPKHTFSFGGSIQWKGLDFSLMFQGVAGNKIYNGMKQLAMNARNDYGNLITDVLNTWDFNNAGSKYPRLGIAEDLNGNYTKFSDVFLEKGDYLRLKNITLGYTLPIKNKNIPSIRFYGSIDNVFTMTGYSGVDPEVGNYGVDRGVYPVTRLFNFGVNVNF